MSNLSKSVKAVRPYSYLDNSNFKVAPYLSWKESGGRTIDARPLEKYYKSMAYHLDLPTIYSSKREARLRFVEGACVRFDTFPDYLFHEVIPVIWDCWPMHWPTMEKFFRRHDIRTAFFTSSQTAEHFRLLFLEKKIFHLPEAIDTDIYKKGKPLKERTHDFLEFGRVCSYVDVKSLPAEVNVLSSKNENGTLSTREKLIEALADSKITICLPRCVNQSEIAGDIETLTQRYWECMLSRVLIIGKAPKELVDIIGYDPLVNLNKDCFSEQIQNLLHNIEDYQELVDRNREVALKMGGWNTRMAWLRERLFELGYES